MARPEPRRTSRGFYLEDLVLRGAAGRGDLDGLALLVADDGLADRRLVRELILRRVRFGRADDLVFDRLLSGAVAGENSSYTVRQSQPNRHLRFSLYAGKSS